MSRHYSCFALVLCVTIGFRQPVLSGGPEDMGKPQPAAGDRKHVDFNGESLPEGVIARLGQSRRKHDGRVNALVYSPNGKILASAGDDHVIRFWDAETDRELRQLAGHKSQVNCVAFSPDGKILASGGEDKTIRFWDVSTGKELSQINKHPGPVVAVAYAPDGKSLVSGGNEEGGNICVWESDNGKEVRRWKAYQDSVYALAFSPDGKRLASAGVRDQKEAAADSYAVAVWDPGTGKRLASCPGHTKRAWAVVFSPDGKLLASAGSDNAYSGDLGLWDSVTGKEVLRVEDKVLRVEPRCIAFTPDGKTLAVGGRGEICLWDVAGAKPLEPISEDAGAYIVRMGFSPNGQTLAVATDSGRTRLWDVARRKERAPGTGHSEYVSAVAVSPDGKMVVSSDGTACLWELSTGRFLRQLPEYAGSYGSAAFAPDGKTLALDYRRDAISLWDPATGKLTGRIPIKDNNRVTSIAFSPDGKWLVSGGIDDKHLYLWDVTTRREIRKFAATEEGAFRVAFSSDGRTIAANGGALYLWDAVTGKQLRRLEGRPLSMAFSPDGSLLAHDRGPVRLLEVATGQEIGQIEDGDATNMAFSPDGQFIALLSHEVRLIDVVTGRAMRKFRGSRGSALSCLAFSPDGKTLVTGCMDCTTLVWDLSDLAEKSAKATLKPEQVRVLWDDLKSDDRLKAYDARCRLRRSPEQVLTLLQKQLRPAEAVDPKRIARLIADLDSDGFEAREKSTQELGELGAVAEKALRQSLKDDPSAEVRRRVERLLSQLGTSPEAQRTLWGLSLLERLGVPEARRLLEALAKGDPESLQTQEAKASLDRLTRNGPAPR